MEDSTARPETPVPSRRDPQQETTAGTQFFGRIFGFPNTPAATPRQDVSDDGATTPIQAAEMPTTLNPRPSRASSIVSTKTNSTIATLQDDARSTRSGRSIDLMLGGKLFHINRDGSKISVSTDNDLPPYSPPVPAYIQASSHPTVQAEPQSPEPTTPTAPSPPPVPEPASRSRIHIPFWTDRARHRRQSSGTARGSLGLLNSNSMFDLSKLPSASKFNTDLETKEENGVYRSPSFVPGPEKISVISKRRAASQGNIPDNLHPSSDNKDANHRLRRRNGVRLPRLFTGITDMRLGSGPSEHDQDLYSSPNGHTIQSAGPSFGSHQRKLSQSPVFTSRSSNGGFPIPSSSYATHLPPNNKVDTRRPSLPNIPTFSLAVPESPAQVEEGHADTEAPPPMEDENDVSIHYTRLIRSIDRDHRKALHARDQELAAMRQRLNEVDQVYRKELKSRDFTIDDLRKRLENLQEQMAENIEQAKNKVEDMWEVRWKHRDGHLVERMRRMELESQIQVERAVAERDEEWAAEWAERNRVLLERLKVAESGAAGRGVGIP
ncbi:hypothetical protein AJ79_10219 [Helicocarpus griseus UAMH5409]|uniref:Uncharacterized protein n=1 Tax=Helicocarpus griseus UAMH5409 TaxID=1447875 RepID=A0A2B7WF05_9EURO|nr:hypothetical protein AJ79_10219 [Helicocarpus griseus UAMH5409]